jgi:hypothetical protein
MTYNEPEYLPIWCKYYGEQFGKANCYIIDHGSDDGSTDNLNGFSVLRLPRSPKDNDRRTRFVSRLCSNLLEWYDGVLHTDVDEIAVVDRERHGTLAQYMATRPAEIVNALGFDVVHVPTEEADIDLQRPVLEQRNWMRFSSSMCKPVFAYRPINWSPGFHSADAPITFGDVFLLHLRYFDLGCGLRRLDRTRSMAWASEKAGLHQRMPDQEFEAMARRMGRLPQRELAGTSQHDEPLAGYIRRVLASERDFRSANYNLDLHIFGDELFRIPTQFRCAF